MTNKQAAIAKSLLCSSLLMLAAASESVHAEGTTANSSKAVSGTFIDFLKTRQPQAAVSKAPAASSAIRLASHGSTQVFATASATSGSAAASLPLWTFTARSSRDGQFYEGAAVGSNPFTNPRSTSVPTKIIPVIFHFNAVGTAIDSTTGGWTTVPGSYTASPVARDHVCLSAPNDVPARILRQSPLFNPVSFSFGGTPVGDTQYIDALQRANFYYASAGVPANYHVLLSPVDEVEGIEIDVPASEGAAMPSAIIDATFGVAPSGPGCGTLGLVDINWFDFLVNTQLIPDLATKAGVTPGTLPVFFVYNTVLGGSPSVGFGNCCIGGYHSSGGFPTPTQTYSVADFDTTTEFGTAFANTAVISHELGEWANDPFGINLVPPWGGTGQVSGCQSNLEVGDPLTGTLLPPITGANGFVYDLQELAFFSWFLGAPSVALHGWFSDNGTFTTDAGTPCTIQ